MYRILEKIHDIFVKVNKSIDTDLKKKSLVEFLEEIYRINNYTWDPEINIFGIMVNEVPKINRFDDYIGVCFRDKDGWRVKIYRGSMQPGTYWIDNPMKKEGAATINLGFHRNIWVVGRHRKTEPALVQHGEAVSFWRDLNKDGIKQPTEKNYKDWIGLNCHPASDRVPKGEEYKVDRYSAGCQVIKWFSDWKEFIGIVTSSDKYKKNSKAKFSYLALSWNDLPDWVKKEIVKESSF